MAEMSERFREVGSEIYVGAGGRDTICAARRRGYCICRLSDLNLGRKGFESRLLEIGDDRENSGKVRHGFLEPSVVTRPFVNASSNWPHKGRE